MNSLYVGALYLTQLCNFKCSYCMNKVVHPFEDRSQAHMSVFTMEYVARSLLNMHKSSYTIKLFGGEPTLHPHLYKMVRILTEILGNKDLDLVLITNGSSPEIVHSLLREYPQLRVSISVHLENRTPAFYLAYLPMCERFGARVHLHAICTDKLLDPITEVYEAFKNHSFSLVSAYFDRSMTPPPLPASFVIPHRTLQEDILTWEYEDGTRTQLACGDSAILEQPSMLRFTNMYCQAKNFTIDMNGLMTAASACHKSFKLDLCKPSGFKGFYEPITKCLRSSCNVALNNWRFPKTREVSYA